MYVGIDRTQVPLWRKWVHVMNKYQITKVLGRGDSVNVQRAIIQKKKETIKETKGKDRTLL